MRSGTKLELVDINKYGFKIEPRYYFYGWSKSPEIIGKKSAVRALVLAKKFLPKGYNFKIWDCQRPRKVNIAMLESFKKRLKILYPRLTEKQIKKLQIRFGGPVPPPLRITRLATHRNGGSFDLTIVDEKVNELYMGTDHDDLTEKAGTDYFEEKSLTALEKEALKNRRLLKRVMIKAGFKNYSAEWWHWSYDK